MLGTKKLAWAALPPPPLPPATPAPTQPFHRLDRSFYVVDDAFGGRSSKEPSQPLLDCDSAFLRGDFNRINGRDLEDVAILMNCVFLAPSRFYCLTCVGDLNCDQRLSAADVAILLWLYYVVDPDEDPDPQIRCPELPGGGK